MHQAESGRASLGKKICRVAVLYINGYLLGGVCIPSCSKSYRLWIRADPKPGVMIGEMWDLERLCERAQALGRHTCFVSSVPLKVCMHYPQNLQQDHLTVSRFQAALPAHQMQLQYFRTLGSFQLLSISVWHQATGRIDVSQSYVTYL
jgi:hypothetical protein